MARNKKIKFSHPVVKLTSEGKNVYPLNDFSGGLNTFVAPQFLNDNEVQDCQNVLFDEKIGSVVKRNGYSLKSTLPVNEAVLRLFNYTKSNGDIYIIAQVSSFKVYQTRDFQTWTLVPTTDSLTGLADFAVFEDYLWITNGVNEVRIFDGTNVWILDGRTYSSGSVPTNETLPYVTPNVPRGKYITVLNDRIFIANTPDNNSEIRFSNFYNTAGASINAYNKNAWPAINQLAVAQDDGSMINGIAVYFNRLVCFKGSGNIRSMYAVVGTSPTNYTIVNIPTIYSTLYHYSAKIYKGILTFLGQDNIYGFNGSTVVKMSQKIENIIKTIQQVLVRFLQRIITGQNDWEAGTLSELATQGYASGTTQLPQNFEDTTTADFNQGTLSEIAVVSGDDYGDGAIKIADASLKVETTDTQNAYFDREAAQRVYFSNTVVIARIDALVNTFGLSLLYADSDCDIYSDNNGEIGSLLYSGLGNSFSKTNNTWQWRTVGALNYNQWIVLPAGYYWIKISQSGGFWWGIGYNNNNPYPYGRVYYYGDNTYYDNYDLVIRIYGLSGEPVFDSRVYDTGCKDGVHSWPSLVFAPRGVDYYLGNSACSFDLYIGTSNNPSSGYTWYYLATFNSDTNTPTYNMPSTPPNRYIKYRVKLKGVRQNVESLTYPLPYIKRVVLQPANSGSFISPKYYLSSVTAYAVFLADYQKNSQTLNLYIRAAATEAGIDTATWHSIDNGQVPNELTGSAVYAQLKAEFSRSAGANSPVLNSMTIQYYTGGLPTQQAVAWIWKDRYLLFCAQSGSSANDIAFVIDKNGAFTKFTGISIASLADYGQELLAGSSQNDGKIYTLFPEGVYSDNGTAIDAYFITKSLSFGSFDHQKAIKHIWVDAQQTSNYTLKVDYSLDSFPAKTLTATIVQNGFFNWRFNILASGPDNARGKLLKLKFYNNNNNETFDIEGCQIYWQLLKVK